MLFVACTDYTLSDDIHKQANNSMHSEGLCDLNRNIIYLFQTISETIIRVLFTVVSLLPVPLV